jgi:hypothetical protein
MTTWRRGLGSNTYTSQILAAIPQYCPSCPPSLVTSLVNTESGGNQFTSSGGVLTSSAGAEGLFQLMPATAAGLSVNPADPSQNIQGGLTLLQQLYNQYGNWTQALEAYNEGGGNLAAQIAAGQTPVSAGYASSILSAAGISTDSSGMPNLSDTGSLDDSDSTGDPLPFLAIGGLPGVAVAGIGLAVIGLLWAASA